jgi:hypothetical protein
MKNKNCVFDLLLIMAWACMVACVIGWALSVLECDKLRGRLEGCEQRAVIIRDVCDGHEYNWPVMPGALELNTEPDWEVRYGTE